MKLSLGFSPCPNDTFIFDAMLHGKIDTEGLEFEPFIADVEELNQKAFKNELHITKLSYHAFAHLVPFYQLLNSGSALGNNCGPLLISKREISSEEVKNCRVGIPGKYTTANFLLSLAYPEIKEKVEMLFSDIEGALLKEEIDAGLIIHENRFTYTEKGLKKIIDLGTFWESKTGMPIPLGGIVVQRSLPKDSIQKINRVLQKSVRFALDNPEESKFYVRQYAQEMDEDVMYQHINLYVNEYTWDLGESGKKAVQHLFEMAEELKIIPKIKEEIFI